MINVTRFNKIILCLLTGSGYSEQRGGDSFSFQTLMRKNIKHRTNERENKLIRNDRVNWFISQQYKFMYKYIYYKS